MAGLQSYYEKYREDQSEVSFLNLYHAAAKFTKARNRSQVQRGCIGDSHDADTIFDEVLYKLSQQDGIYDFERLFLVALKRGRIDLLRKVSRRRARTVYGYDFERIKFVEAVEADRRGFINTLVERSRDKRAELITETVLSSDGRTSVSALCASIGLHHHVGFRSLQRLRKYYNPEIDGELTEFIS